MKGTVGVMEKWPPWMDVTWESASRDAYEANLVLVQDSGEDRRRIEIWDAVTLN